MKGFDSFRVYNQEFYLRSKGGNVLVGERNKRWQEMTKSDTCSSFHILYKVRLKDTLLNLPQKQHYALANTHS
jgi:hypothetical protein